MACPPSFWKLPIFGREIARFRQKLIIPFSLSSVAERTLDQSPLGPNGILSVMRTPVRSRLTGNRKGTRMEKRTFKKAAPLNQRLEEQAKRLRKEAKGTPPGIEREKLIRQARQAETAAHIDKWLTSPGLQAPR
jgi:hypothetical protein